VRPDPREATCFAVPTARPPLELGRGSPPGPQADGPWYPCSHWADTVNGNTERSLRTEEHTAALAAEVQVVEEASQAQSTIKALDARKRARATASVPEHSHAHPK
jgi:hypothetical protein